MSHYRMSMRMGMGMALAVAVASAGAVWIVGWERHGEVGVVEGGSHDRRWWISWKRVDRRTKRV
jgi:hypothetical protein